MSQQNNYINLKYNEKFQVEIILANNSPVEDVYNKINPLNVLFNNKYMNLHNLINIFYSIFSSFMIIFLKPLINRPIYNIFNKLEYMTKIDYFYIFLPLIIMALMEILFNFLIKDRFKPAENNRFLFSDLKNLFISLICKGFLYLASLTILDNHLHKFNKYASDYLGTKVVKSKNIINIKAKYINYNWHIINYIYIGAFVLNIFLYFLFISVYDTRKKNKYLYIKTQLSEYYTKDGLVENVITKNICKELFN